MQTRFWIGLAALIAGCDPEVNTGTGGTGAAGGSTNTAGTGGATGGTGGSTPQCDAAPYLNEVGTPIEIQIINQTGATAFIYGECSSQGGDGIAIDNKTPMAVWYTCEDMLACVYGGDCFGAPDLQIEPGITFTTSWDGALESDESLTPPKECISSCDGLFFSSCKRMVAAPAGSHTLTVSWGTEEGGPYQDVSVPFDSSQGTVTVTLGP